MKSAWKGHKDNLFRQPPRTFWSERSLAGLRPNTAADIIYRQHMLAAYRTINGEVVVNPQRDLVDERNLNTVLRVDNLRTFAELVSVCLNSRLHRSSTFSISGVWDGLI